MITEEDKKRILAKKVKGHRAMGDYGDEKLHMTMASALGIPILVVDKIKLNAQTSVDPDVDNGAFNFISEAQSKMPCTMSFREATNLFKKRTQKRPMVLVHNGRVGGLGHYDAITKEETTFMTNGKFKSILSNLGYYKSH